MRTKAKEAGLMKLDRLIATKQILEQKFPVFYKYRVSNGSLGRCMITHYQVPVRIGKVTVRPGDIIFGDIVWSAVK